MNVVSFNLISNMKIVFKIYLVQLKPLIIVKSIQMFVSALVNSNSVCFNIN